jgi:hypothetical protein
MDTAVPVQATGATGVQGTEVENGPSDEVPLLHLREATPPPNTKPRFRPTRREPHRRHASVGVNGWLERHR